MKAEDMLAFVDCYSLVPELISMAFVWRYSIKRHALHNFSLNSTNKLLSLKRTKSELKQITSRSDHWQARNSERVKQWK